MDKFIKTIQDFASVVKDFKIEDLRRSQFKFIVYWIIVTIISWILSHVISEVLPISETFSVREDTGIFLEGCLGGAILGLLQGLSLKNFFEKTWWVWILVTAIGWGIGWTNTGMFEEGLSFPEDAIALSLMQFTVLLFGFKISFLEAIFWIIVTIIAWTFGWNIIVANWPDYIWGKILGGFVDGVITGFFMKFLLRKYFNNSN